MSDYEAIWPIEDDSYLTPDLKAEALPDLYELLEQAGVCQDGPIRWTRKSTLLIARLPVIAAEPAVEGDMRPWVSRAGQVAELLDRVAA